MGRACGAVGYGSVYGMWRSLVARLLWEQEAAGSNPAIPTTNIHVRHLACDDAEPGRLGE